MSSRGVTLNTLKANRPWLLICGLSLLCLCLWPASAGAQVQTAISIDTLTGVGLGQEIELGIDLATVAPGAVFAGFDLLIAYDFAGLRLLSVEAGQLLEDCQWEYFDYSTGPFDCEPWYLCDRGLVRIIAVAHLGGAFTCYADAPGELARMRFLTTVSRNFLDNLEPVRFYWLDCGDNTLSNVAGDTLFISDRVYEFGHDMTDPYEDFPTYFGAPNDCDTLDRVVRSVDYYNGWVYFASDDTLALEPSLSLLPSGENYTMAGDTFTFVVQLDQTAPGVALGGYDLLLQYDDTGFTFLGAQPGELHQTCQWEYFTYSLSPLSGCDGAPSPDNVVRLVALADVNNGPVHPSCYGEAGGSLAELSFLVIDDSTLNFKSFGVNWLWCDCTDNTVSSRQGDSLWLSRSVYDVYGFPISADTSFPTISGAPEICDGGQGVERLLTYFAGSVRYEYYHDEIDWRGDINLDGIAYTIADWVIYTNYFLYGLEAFTVNMEAQVAASDVNADGLTLTLADLVYLVRVIEGDAQPFPLVPLAPGDTVIVIQDTVADVVWVEYDDSLSALYFVFSDSIEPSTGLSEHLLAWHFNGSDTRVLIQPRLEGYDGLPVIPSGTVITCAGDGILTSAAATYDGLSQLPTQIVIGEAPCCRVRGNIDGDSEGEINVADLVYLVTCMFASGPLPACPAEADINGNGIGPDIADLIGLVSYMFGGCPACLVPCP